MRFLKMPAWLLMLHTDFVHNRLLCLRLPCICKLPKISRLKKIIYGAFDGRSNDNIAPILDLTPFLEIANWASATEQFLKYGDATRLKDQLRATQGKTYSPDSPFRALRLLLAMNWQN